MKTLSPAEIRTLTPVQSSGGPSMLMLAILAAVGYGGYRIYKHFRKG